MNTIPIMKQQSKSYNSFPPIAPAIAPRPVQVLPKPIAKLNTETDRQTPCIITSKQWVLPPRPKSGRKPSANSEKKKTQGKPRQSSISSTSSMTNLSNNLVSLNLNKSQSENILLNGIEDDALKTQLESATEENQKLKSIISRLKTEIDQLQRRKPLDSALSPPQVSTPTVSNVSITPREMSPSTVDPKEIGIAKPKKRQYKKKKKSKEEFPPAIPKESTPSPLPLSLESTATESNLPSIEPILDDRQPIKKTKLTSYKLERSASLSTDLMSPPSSFMLDRSLSTPVETFEWHSGLSRTTTNTTLDPNDFGWPGRDCGFCSQDGSCLCLEKASSGLINHVGSTNGFEDKRELMERIENNVINESDELEGLIKDDEVFIKAEEDIYDEFLMI